MADIIFTDATVLSYDVENYFLGDGVARYGSTKRLSIEVMSYNVNVSDFNNEGVSETWDNLTTYLNNANNFENIKIKVGGTDWDLGKGIIDSISTTEQNPIRVGYHRFSIEIPYASIDNLPSTGSYEGIKDAFESGTIGNNAELIRDFSESFNFSEDEDGTYTHEHSVSIRFEEGKSGVDEIAKGKAFAAKLFEGDEAPPFGFAVRPGLFDDTGIKDKRHYYTETYDAFTKTCSFVKRLTIEDEDETTYTKKVRHTTNLEANGIISVTENCEIKGKDSYAQALAGMETEIALADNRCATVFTGNAKFLGNGGKYNGSNSEVEVQPSEAVSPSSLKLGTTGLSRLNQAIAISKQHNKRKKTVSYTITFNNDPTITNDYIHEFSQNYTENQNGALTVTQNGRIRPYGQKDNNALASIKAFFKEVQDGGGTNGQISFRSRAEQYYLDLADQATGATVKTDLKPTATSVTFGGGKAGMEISYSKSFSDDLPLRYSYGVSSAGSSAASQVAMPATLKRLNISIADTVPQLIRSTYAIPNKSDGYQLLHEPDDSLGKQTNMGVRTVEIKAQKARVSSQNVYSNFPSLTSDLTYLRQLALIKAAEVVPDLKLPSTDLFLESCSYSFNNNREITFRISTKYATKSNLAYNNIHPTAINT